MATETESDVKLVCEICNCDYTKPARIKRLHLENPADYTYKNMLLYCDACRRKRMIDMMQKAMPKVLEALSTPNTNTSS